MRAHLAGVPRSVLQKMVRDGTLATSEGMVTSEELLRVFPDVRLAVEPGLERMTKIKEEAFGRRVRERTLPTQEVLAQRLFAQRGYVAGPVPLRRERAGASARPGRGGATHPRAVPVKTIPIVAAQDPALSACSGAEPFALMVLGDAMAPEFLEGDVIVIEPEGLATDGSFVLANVEGEWMFRQLVAREGGWKLAALDGRTPSIDIAGLGAVRGVVIQRSRPGRRGENRLYGR